MRTKRIEKNLSIEDTARMLNWAPARLSAYECGAPISLNQLKRFSQLFFIDTEEIVDAVLEFCLCDSPSEE